ncbi:MAG TPA: class I SAM-dependent methyltransferase [Chthoniobacteraceae bacterium]|nr:class I SAM-dependent methyltransferase [Chthoniobacteraceae bacterium]
MATDPFAFGKNWRAFVDKYLNAERITEARQSLVAFTKGYDFRGKRFVDIGCGSGLFSLCAHRLGADVTSFDVDPDSVACCQFLREQEGRPENWRVLHGSVLDEAFVRELGQFDFVYSWGVLHHTGEMWRAIENASNMVESGGSFYLAIYNKADGFAFYDDGRFGPSSLWLREKMIYSSLPPLAQAAVDYAVMGAMIALYAVTLQNPVKKIRNHKALRGMSWRIDIKDWLGGYPYEYASVAEIFAFLEPRGFTLKNLISTNGLRNNEFLFVRG